MIKIDLYFSENGDLRLTPAGDIAVTETEWRDDAQQAYIRIMTEPGDWTLYPNLGAELSRLYGMPQTEATANYGKSIIEAALSREGRFQGKTLHYKAVPTGPTTIRFDVYVASPSRNSPLLSIEQDLGIS